MVDGSRQLLNKCNIDISLRPELKYDRNVSFFFPASMVGMNRTIMNLVFCACSENTPLIEGLTEASN